MFHGFADPKSDSLPLHLISPDELSDFLQTAPEATKTWVNTLGFNGGLGTSCLLPGPDGTISGALIGWGTATARKRQRFGAVKGVANLPKNSTWHIASPRDSAEISEFSLGWLLAGYSFTRYRKQDEANPAPQGPRLQAHASIDQTQIEVLARAEFLTRDLINTPSEDMGPDELEAAFCDLAKQFNAQTNIIRGEALLKQNFPLIHTVGRASPRAPRLLELNWGNSGPKITLVGKGVCFDTGGLDLKAAAGMLQMKKDMGGAATVLGLAQAIMTLGLKVQLRVLIPAVENSVSGNAMRPRDIIKSRKGLTVEINNTDAEGRLILADALAYACESPCDVLISMATLTGAARVAVGPDLAPYYAQDDAMAAALESAAKAQFDPIWRMPFHDAYESMLEPSIADLDNAPSGGFAGSITAALFLRRFADHPGYVHFDIFGHQPTDAPARPRGGAGQGARAILGALSALMTQGTL